MPGMCSPGDFERHRFLRVQCVHLTLKILVTSRVPHPLARLGSAIYLWQTTVGNWAIYCVPRMAFKTLVISKGSSVNILEKQSPLCSCLYQDVITSKAIYMMDYCLFSQMQIFPPKTINYAQQNQCHTSYLDNLFTADTTRSVTHEHRNRWTKVIVFFNVAGAVSIFLIFFWLTTFNVL